MGTPAISSQPRAQLPAVFAVMSVPTLLFPPFRLDPADGSLWHGARRIALSPTDFGVLYYLAAHAGQLVTHEALLAAVWPTTVVGKGVLKVRLHRIRQALGDHAGQPRFIETAQRRGYRFIAPVSRESVPTAPQPSGAETTVGSVRPGATPTAFVGRELEMTRLRAALADAAAGTGQLVLLVGEAGIGKSRLVDEFAIETRARGIRVLTARSHEGQGAPPFWPWMQIVRACVDEQAPAALKRALGRGGARIAQLIPEVREVLPALPVVPVLDPEHERFHLFDAFADFLKRIAGRGALVIALDDLHWADTPSLLLLQFVARALAGAHLLIVATYREVPLADEHPLASVLGELARNPGSQRLALRGFSEADLAQFVALVTQQQPPPSLVAALRETTEGNPFFVTEVVQAMVGEGRLASSEQTAACGLRIDLPQRVREAITHRLSSLSTTCLHVLTVASVIGRDFELSLLNRALAVSKRAPTNATLLAALDEAVAAHFIAADRSGRYSFCHALIRQALYESLNPARRMLLHRQIGNLLEEMRNGDQEKSLAELAAHFYLAAPDGDVGKAIDYAARAGQQAMTLLAYEEAARQYQRALQGLELKPDADRRCELLLALGEAQRQAGQSGLAKETFAAAAALARARAFQAGPQVTAPLLARAALGVATGFAGITATGGVADTFILDLLEEALRALGEEDSALRARVLARLAVELYFSDEPERRTDLSAQAVEMARRSGDRAALAFALNARSVAVWTPDTLAERLAVAGETMRLADEVGDRDLSLRGHMRRLGALLELGDLRTADREIAVYAQRAKALRQPSHLWFLATWKAMRACMRGDFEPAEAFAREAFEIGQRAQDPDAAQCFTVQIFGIRSGGKGLEDVELPARDFATEYAAVPAWRAGMALLYADLGNEVAARQEFEQLAANDFADLARDADWMVTMASLAQLCAFLRDGSRAALLYERLRPYAARCVVVGHGLVCLGSVERFLALLSAAQQRWEDADAHFTAAVTRNRQLGAKSLVALTQREHALMFLARNQKGDRARAMRVFDETLALARQLGMEDLTRRVLAFKEADTATPPALEVIPGGGGRAKPVRRLGSRSRSRRG
jgi:DNA-binding winged helix-turn-helix (wHTH) protein/tetratricopeptide (TPR) repeat protein